MHVSTKFRTIPMKKRLLVDMDGVLADIYQQAINFEYEESGRLIKLEDIEGDDEIVAFPNASRHVRQSGFFRTAPLIPNGLKFCSSSMKCTKYS